jgi:CheY-like chemotaxis protein
VVDDEADIRDAIRALLEGWGHSVEVAADGQAGYELVVASRPDVALLDIGMPKMDGYTAAQEIRDELGPETPRLVAMTGFGREQDREKARRAGFDAHLTKPAPPRLLRRALRSS